MKRLALLLSIALLVTACSTGTGGDTTTTAAPEDTATTAPEEETTTTAAVEDTTTTTTSAAEETTTTAVDDTVEVEIVVNEGWVMQTCTDELSDRPIAETTLAEEYTKSQMEDLLYDASDLHFLFVMQCIGDEDYVPWYMWVYPGDVVTSLCESDSEDGTKDYTVDDWGFFYCNDEWAVWTGLEKLWFYYEDFGAPAATTIVMHEVGHHVQELQGVPWDQNPPRLREMQADCISGSFVGWAEERGYVDPNEVGYISGMYEFIGSDDLDPDRFYGNSTERTRSFEKGRVGGLEVCIEIDLNSGPVTRPPTPTNP